LSITDEIGALRAIGAYDRLDRQSVGGEGLYYDRINPIYSLEPNLVNGGCYAFSGTKVTTDAGRCLQLFGVLFLLGGRPEHYEIYRSPVGLLVLQTKLKRVTLLRYQNEDYARVAWRLLHKRRL
jgi:hypothetical protein